MRSLLFTIAIIFCVTIKSLAQAPQTSTEDKDSQDKKSFKERLIFGGGLGAQFGSNTYVNVSPIIGYKITEKFTAGIGLTYVYSKAEYYTDTLGNPVSLEHNIYGGNLWSEYRILPQVFLHAEYGLLNTSLSTFYFSYPYYYYAGETPRVNIYNLFVGGGYYQEIGNNAGFQLSILWDLIEDKNSPYDNPIIRVGFVAGF